MDVPITEDPARVREIVTKTKGNLTRAARLLDISKPHMMNVVRRFHLNEWARDLRVAHGYPPTGNPRTTRKRAIQAVP